MLPQFNQYFELITKIFFITGSILYVIFALVVVKQTKMMSKNVNDKFNLILVTFSYAHLIFSIFIVFIALLVL